MRNAVERWQNISIMVTDALVCALSLFVRFGLHQRLIHFSKFEAWGSTLAPMILGVWSIVFGLIGYLHEKRQR